MIQLLDSQVCHKWSSNVLQYAVDWNSVSGNFLTETWSQRVSFDLEAAGPKPVLVCIRLLLCESLWKKVLSGKDPTDKACNTAGSNNGVDISRWGLVSKYPGFWGVGFISLSLAISPMTTCFHSVKRRNVSGLRWSKKVRRNQRRLEQGLKGHDVNYLIISQFPEFHALSNTRRGVEFWTWL